MKSLLPPSRRVRRYAAFSLVEVAVALGIVGFALVGIVGAIPVAMNNARLSIAQSRAATLANTMFASFRTQPFGAVQYLDLPVGTVTPSKTLNLDVLSTSDTQTFYAGFDEIVPSTATTDARRLHFLNDPPSTSTYPTIISYFKIVLHFDNNPTGTLKPSANSSRAEANTVEASISEADRPNDVFRFTSVIANRSE